MQAFALVGLNPPVDAVRYVMHFEQFQGQNVPNAQVLIQSRSFEVLFESNVQSLLLSSAMMRPGHRSHIQVISLVSSFFTTGNPIATADRDLDLETANREKERLIFGYVSLKPFTS